MSETPPVDSVEKKKRQHFVPKFYLRNFSFDGGKHLHLVHIEKLLAIPRIGLKGLCYEDYFYGEDPVVENALQDLEGVASGLFRWVIAEQRLPARGTPEDFIFRTYVCLQWGRTKSQAERSEALLSKALKATFAPQWLAAGITQEEIDKLEFGTKKPGLQSLGITADMVPFMGDLDTKLITAGAIGEFVTCDAPVVLINPFYFGRFPGCVTGLNLRGLVILFPISPQLLAILYDGECYNVGSPDHHLVTLACQGDLAALNNFQCLNADDGVYFHDEKFSANHLEEFAKVISLRSRDRGVVIEAPSNEPSEKSSLLHTYQADIPYLPNFSFLTLRRDRRDAAGDVTRLEERNPEILAHFDEYQRELKSGAVKRGFLIYNTEKVFAKAGQPLPDWVRDPRVAP